MTKNKEDFFQRNKKLIIAFVGLQFAPLILVGAGLFGMAIWMYSNNDANFHPYKYLIIDGYNKGLKDGAKDKNKYDSVFSVDLGDSPWTKYYSKTIDLKPLIKKELKEYLAQFPEDERSKKIFEKKQNNILLPMERKYNERFHNPVEFYTDYVAKKIKRENYDSDSAYQQAMKKEAWGVGYGDGYIKGVYSGNSTSGRWR